MVVENGLIVEASENELYRLYLARNMDDAISFYEYKARMEAAGCVVVKEN